MSTFYRCDLSQLILTVTNTPFLLPSVIRPGRTYGGDTVPVAAPTRPPRRRRSVSAGHRAGPRAPWAIRPTGPTQ